MKAIILSATLLLCLASCKKEEIEDTYTVSVYSIPSSQVNTHIHKKEVGGLNCPADYTYKSTFPCFTTMSGRLKPGKWVSMKFYKNNELIYQDSIYNHSTKDSSWSQGYFWENANR